VFATDGDHSFHSGIGEASDFITQASPYYQRLKEPDALTQRIDVIVSSDMSSSFIETCASQRLLTSGKQNSHCFVVKTGMGGQNRNGALCTRARFGSMSTQVHPQKLG
jgi:hypothetical protein